MRIFKSSAEMTEMLTEALAANSPNDPQTSFSSLYKDLQKRADFIRVGGISELPGNEGMHGYFVLLGMRRGTSIGGVFLNPEDNSICCSFNQTSNRSFNGWLSTPGVMRRHFEDALRSGLYSRSIEGFDARALLQADAPVREALIDAVSLRVKERQALLTELVIEDGVRKGLKEPALRKFFAPGWIADPRKEGLYAWICAPARHDFRLARLDLVNQNFPLASAFQLNELSYDPAYDAALLAGGVDGLLAGFFPDANRHLVKALGRLTSRNDRHLKHVCGGNYMAALLVEFAGRTYPARYISGAEKPEGVARGVSAVLTSTRHLREAIRYAHYRSSLPSERGEAELPRGYQIQRDLIDRRIERLTSGTVNRDKTLFSRCADEGSGKSELEKVWIGLHGLQDFVRDIFDCVIRPVIAMHAWDSEEFASSARIAEFYWIQSFFGNRSIRELINLNKRWHEASHSLSRAISSLNKDTPRWEPLATDVYIGEDDPILFSAATDAISLLALGKSEQHCVGSYINACVTSNTHIIVARRGTKVVGTMEIRIDGPGSLRMVQFQARSNRPPEPAVQRAGEQYLKVLTEHKLVDYDLLKDACSERVMKHVDEGPGRTHRAGYDIKDPEAVRTAYAAYRTVLPQVFTFDDHAEWVRSLLASEGYEAFRHEMEAECGEHAKPEAA